MKPIKIFLLLFVLFSTATGCKKEKQQKLESKTVLLTRAPWVVINEEVYIEGKWIKDDLGVQRQNIIITFRKDGTYVIEDRLGKFVYKKWEFLENGNKIKMEEVPPIRTITVLTKDQFQFTSTSPYPGEPEERYTFIHP